MKTHHKQKEAKILVAIRKNLRKAVRLVSYRARRTETDMGSTSYAPRVVQLKELLDEYLALKELFERLVDLKDRELFRESWNIPRSFGGLVSWVP